MSEIEQYIDDALRRQGEVITVPELSMKMMVIIGEDKFFELFDSIEDLTLYTDVNKIFLFYFPVDLERMLSFIDCHSRYTVKPYFVGNYKEEDRLEFVRLHLAAILKPLYNMMLKMDKFSAGYSFEI